MTIRPSTPEIITVNSDALETQIRDLLPSQNGFGSELQASNVITPIIDLTAAAEGSGLPEYMQTALSFGSQTAFEVTNTTTTLTSNPGFYRLTGTASIRSVSGADTIADFNMTDGVSTKDIYKIRIDNPSTVIAVAVPFDFTVFVGAGITLSATVSSDDGFLCGSFRQVADSTGTLVQPVGFPL